MTQPRLREWPRRDPDLVPLRGNCRTTAVQLSYKAAGREPDRALLEKVENFLNREQG